MPRWIQHIFNPLHAYCRLRSIGFSKSWAISLSERWAKVYNWLCGHNRPARRFMVFEWGGK